MKSKRKAKVYGYFHLHSHQGVIATSVPVLSSALGIPVSTLRRNIRKGYYIDSNIIIFVSSREDILKGKVRNKHPLWNNNHVVVPKVDTIMPLQRPKKAGADSTHKNVVVSDTSYMNVVVPDSTYKTQSIGLGVAGIPADELEKINQRLRSSTEVSAFEAKYTKSPVKGETAMSGTKKKIRAAVKDHVPLVEDPPVEQDDSPFPVSKGKSKFPKILLVSNPDVVRDPKVEAIKKLVPGLTTGDQI